jgi:hypothetical protein
MKVLLGINEILIGYTTKNNLEVLIFNTREGGPQGIQTWERLMLRLENIMCSNLRTAFLSSEKNMLVKPSAIQTAASLVSRKGRFWGRCAEHVLTYFEDRFARIYGTNPNSAFKTLQIPIKDAT